LLSCSPTYKIGFPGWPEPNLDSVLVFWGVSLEKGACTSPLFHYGPMFCHCSSWWLAGAEGSLLASVSSKWFSSEGLSVRALFSFLRTPIRIRCVPWSVGARHVYPELRRAVPALQQDLNSHKKPGPNPRISPVLRQTYPPRRATNPRVQVADAHPRQFFGFERSTVGCELVPKKMSGRWGDRPLGRGGWRVLQPEASPVLPTVLLRSRAAERDTGANRPKPFYSGSRN
jgi:hypothetical protein